MTARDLSHVMYSYSVRSAGNPDFHKALLEQMKPLIKGLDYPSLHNLIYYLMFTDNQDKHLWE